MITGESMPAAKQAGSKLIGSTINGTGAPVMRVEKVGSDTMLARIIAMVAEAQRSRADPAACRSDIRVIRAGGRQYCRDCFHRVGHVAAAGGSL